MLFILLLLLSLSLPDIALSVSVPNAVPGSAGRLAAGTSSGVDHVADLGAGSIVESRADGWNGSATKADVLVSGAVADPKLATPTVVKVNVDLGDASATPSSTTSASTPTTLSTSSTSNTSTTSTHTDGITSTTETTTTETTTTETITSSSLSTELGGSLTTVTTLTTITTTITTITAETTGAGVGAESSTITTTTTTTTTRTTRTTTTTTSSSPSPSPPPSTPPTSTEASTPTTTTPATTIPTTSSLGTPTPTQVPDFIPVAPGGGSMLDKSAGLGEPLNVIISARSHPSVRTKTGLTHWAQAVGFSTECLGFHLGTPQTANLGDGAGDVDELGVWRADFRSPLLGTCLESLIGGNHFRAWIQGYNATAGSDGAQGGAVFLAVSQEEDSTQHHNIVPDGYNRGRDSLVNAALGTHQHPFLPYKYVTTSADLTGLLAPGADGVNHNISQDGIVKLLTVDRRSSFDFGF
ncbi:hypothetical protein EYR40_009157 [Pleurotus pulmonarius]|nr:hypothetical protein EYR40_009157 [Pleurotus pulmonarius]